MTRLIPAVASLATAFVLLPPANAMAQVRTDVPVPSLASIQFGTPAPRRRLPQVPPRRGIGYRVYFATDVTQMAAADTFSAVTGSPRLMSFGGGAEVLRVWKGLFLRGGVSRATRTGERVVVFDDDAVGVGIPLEISLMPSEVGAGWRIETGRTRAVGVYVGAGALRLRYQESAEFAAPGDNVDRSFRGYLAFGGLDFTVGKSFVFGAEAQYRTVPDAIGDSGPANAFRETDLGGMTVRVLVGFRK